ncbi:MAG: hypothetical protein ACXVJK_08625 [Candidatus Aminicenantales bacterium]
MRKIQDLGRRQLHARRPNAVRVSLTPGTSVLGLIAAGIEKRVRAGAGLISVSQFLWPDNQRLPALAHTGGKRMTRMFVPGYVIPPVRRRI